MYINIHTHQAPSISHDTNWSLFNIHKNFNTFNSLSYYSMGIHPWYIKNESISEEIIELKMNSTKQNILAIGECGLDRFCETPYKLQQEIFKQQIIWANEIAKPLIIHSVRTYDDVLQTLKDNKNIMPVIFHGFNKNKIIAQKIIASGHYISFGKDVSKSELETVIASVPLDKIFLETDESDLPIEFIYKEFSRIRNIPLSQLILQTNKNLKTVFKI